MSTTYQETCRLYGLLKDGEHWKKTLEEPVVSRLASQIRQLTAIMLTVCEIEQRHLLWGEFKNNMSADFRNQARQQNENMSIKFAQIFITNVSAIYSVDDLNSTLTNCGMPEPDVKIELH